MPEFSFFTSPSLVLSSDIHPVVSLDHLLYFLVFTNFNTLGFFNRFLQLIYSNFVKYRFLPVILISGDIQPSAAPPMVVRVLKFETSTLFGQIWRLQPLRPEKKSLWRREMEWLLCVSDYIVELIPSCPTYPDGSKLEVVTSRPRSDLYVNLPTLRKLDNMLLMIYLISFYIL
ncbi:hypothetical protein L2E82_14876 [Cichorium intybus]|uniref:Uncharacterized protein n=1 Tax=Cichorium intybus TaxID=13427 RepID=A0ACB9F0N5_CICIN|nr:hypothetical protein L2E82_14876 [Cichorium intybus]